MIFELSRKLPRRYPIKTRTKKFSKSELILSVETGSCFINVCFGDNMCKIIKNNNIEQYYEYKNNNINIIFACIDISTI